MLATLRWIALALLPAVLFAILIYRTDKRREPAWLVALTFAFGATASVGAFFIVKSCAKFTGLDVRTSIAGNAGAMLFLFALVAPVREAAKVAACWPAFRSHHFDEPYDGIVYASAAALGFAAVENGLVLHAHPTGIEWVARALLALPAHLFFACLWGYSLGRAKQSKRPGALFPTAWTAATAMHGLYIHFVYGRGALAMLAALPLLAAMGVVVLVMARDLRGRGDRADPEQESLSGSRLSRVSRAYANGPPSFAAVRAALRRADQPIVWRWILFGALVTLGAMFSGLAAAIVSAHLLHIDFSFVDEQDATTAAPVALLGVGLLAAFPISGYLVARASNVSTLLEPALAAALALLISTTVLGMAAPVAVVFALAVSPIAWALACMGAWIGRPAR